MRSMGEVRAGAAAMMCSLRHPLTLYGRADG